ncbi:MAG: mechanosensitive ion channel family protein [Polymorphobacter sp.]|uniref:mechanosensitive ion channel family protein n=1 Tax=Polymorphobacter sp. TaxID=1909290 RepID=UPI003A87D482
MLKDYLSDPASLFVGLPVVDLIIVAVVTVVAWLSGQLLGEWAEARFGASAWLPDGFRGRVVGKVRAGIVFLALIVLLAAPGFGAQPRLVAALALAAATMSLANHLLRGFGVKGSAVPLLAVLAGILAAVAALGGFSPLLMALDNAALRLGSRRISLLDVMVTGLAALALFGLAVLLNRTLGRWLGQMAGLDESQRLLGQKLVGIAIAVVAFFIGIDLLGIDLTSLAVFSGAVGLAVGFGLQKTLGNMIAGVLLLMDRSIKPGDVIVVGDQFGQVNRIGVRAVSVLTRDGKEHLIPNEQLMTQAVENWSYSDRKVRVHIPVGVSYACDLARAQALMLEAARDVPRVMKEPAPGIWLRGFGDSSVDHDIMVWIDDPEEGVGNVRSAVLNRVWVLFKENGIEIPFPQRDVWIKSAPAAVDKGLESE